MNSFRGPLPAFSRLCSVREKLTNLQIIMSRKITLDTLSSRRAHVCRLAILGLVSCATTASAQQADRAASLYGGDHEFGIAAGLSPHGGPIWGYDQNVRYVPVVLRYSYLITQHRNWSLRYAPEVTALSVMYERPHSSTNPAAPIAHYGSGVSPEGFQIDYRPRSAVQPFFTNDGGFIYYNGRVLSPQGSQYMYTIDFGAGVNWFVRRRTALTVGFRYQHLSNANLLRRSFSLQNPRRRLALSSSAALHCNTQQLRVRLVEAPRQLRARDESFAIHMPCPHLHRQTWSVEGIRR